MPVQTDGRAHSERGWQMAVRPHRCYGLCQRYLWERYMEWNLTPTGWSILGFLSLQDRNGYEIRQAARRSVEEFWGVSDGQLYPQLRHLHELGLVAPTRPTADGGPTTWQLTGDGRSALHQWLRAPSAPT